MKAEVKRFSLLFPCYAEIVPCYFSHGVSPKTPMDAAFNDDAVVISGLIFGFSLYFSLLSENLHWRRVRIRLHRQPASSLIALNYFALLFDSPSPF
jgi:hypothetical protein